MTFYELQLRNISRYYPPVEVCERIERAAKFMAENCGTAIRLGQLADVACMSRYHFVRVFRRLYGRTPYQYLTSLRMQKAASALKANFPVTHACLEAGFDSTTTFARRFRISAGATPSAYARAWQKSNIE